MVQSVSAGVVISISVDPVYGVGESVYFYGTLVNGSTPLANETLNVSLEDSSGVVYSSGSTDTSASGEFTGEFTAPSAAGEYLIRARLYEGVLVHYWEGVASFRVVEQSLDEILIYPNKADYYSSEVVFVSFRAVKSSGSVEVGVSNVSIDAAIRYLNETEIKSFSCTTDVLGYCNASSTAPASVGEYILEANDFMGSTVINVIPFDVSVDTLDDTGSSIKSVYTLGQSGKIRVRVSYNGTNPTVGTYFFSGVIKASNGTTVETIPQTPINTSTYTGFHDFTLDDSYSVDSYTVEVTVTQQGVSQSRILAQGGNEVTAQAFFEVSSFQLSVEKESGFRYAYTAFPGESVSFKITLKDRATGNSITSLSNSNFNITLESRTGVVLGTYNVTLNATSSSYNLRLTLPAEVGSFILRVKATYGGATIETQRVLTTTNLMASANPADREGKLKEVFDGTEYVYVKLALENETSDLNLTDIELSSVSDMDGNPVTYVPTNWSSDDNETREWRKNVSSSMLKLDNPRSGGVYFVEVYLNNRTALAKTKFIIDPYSVVADTQDENGNSRWQFAPDETVYVELTVTQAQHASGSAMMEFESDMFSERGGGGGDEGSEGGSTATRLTKPALVRLSSKSSPAKSQSPPPKIGIKGSRGGTAAGGGFGAQLSGTEVSGATVEIIELINDRTFTSIPLSEINYSCTKTNAQGQSTCTINPASGSWEGGWYHIVFLVTGPDNVTKGLGFAGFEVKKFYIYAYSMEWLHKPSDDLTFIVQMYDAGNSMWWSCYYGGCTSSGGLDGRVSVEKILRYGGAGEWVWPPPEYNYSGTFPTVTIRDGSGNLTLTSPSGGWKTGSYTVILRGEKTDANGTVTGTDYGEAWFEVKTWDAYADPVDVSTMQWKQGGFSTRENITLFINIHNAGSWGDGVSLGGLVTVGVKKLEDYSSWPPEEWSASDYTVYPISVNKSASLWTTPNPRYVLVIESNSGRWTPGYYNVVLDINGTETGWGWFEVVAFTAEASFVDENGTQIYTARGTPPIYFNVSSSSGGTPLNTTLKEMILRTWSTASWFPIEFRYPGDLNVTPTAVAGSEILQVSLNSGSLLAEGDFPTGWYDAEIILEDSEGETGTARAWFQIKPFEVITEMSSWDISSSSPVSVGLKTVEDYWTYYASASWSWECSCYAGGNILWGNYTIESVTEYTYSWWGPSVETNLTNYTPQNFNGSANLTINPPGGRWSSGYHSLMITIKDSAGNSAEAWIGFNAQPFRVTVTRYPGAVGNKQNVSIGLSIPQTLNVSRVYETMWGYMGSSEVDYNYTPQTLSSGDEVNLTVVAPPDGWTQEGSYSTWHSLTIVLTDGSDNVSVSIWFDVRSFQVSAWSDPAGKNDNVTLNIYVYEPDWSTPATVNVTKVEYKNWNYYGGAVHKKPAPSIQSSIQQYSDYEEGNYTVRANSTVVNGSGTITLIVPSSGWNEGWYDTRVYLSDLAGEESQTVFTSFSIATCDTECSICNTEQDCNRSAASCRYDNLSDEDNETGMCVSSYGGYVLTCSNDCYSCKSQSNCEASPMNCDWSGGSCVVAGMTCDAQCYYCYTESACLESNATSTYTEWNGSEYIVVNKSCVWDNSTKYCTFEGQTCNDHCWNCYSNASCALSAANCTWSSKQYYCKDASQTCDKGCYNCYEEDECANSTANCTWNRMYQSCYEAWQTCSASCGYCYTQDECTSSAIGKCVWMDYYCQYNYSCSDGCYYCGDAVECNASELGCVWSEWGDWCNENWQTCKRSCYYCSTEEDCVNSTNNCDWNNASSYCEQGCGDNACSNCDTKAECDSTSTCFWSNTSSTCKYSWQNCSQSCYYCGSEAECDESALNCQWNYGYCNQVYTCNESCSSCLNETSCASSPQNCRWRLWDVCEYNYGCSSGCTYCNTELECETSQYSCEWDSLDGKCAYSGSTCNASCWNCYTQSGCGNSSYSFTYWGANGSETRGCVWDNLTGRCATYGSTCSDYCWNCNRNTSCTASQANCSWDRFSSYCTTKGSSCDENCHNCYSGTSCTGSAVNCTWDSLAYSCRSPGEQTCNANCSACTLESACNQSAANCAWDRFGYYVGDFTLCKPEGTPICDTNCGSCPAYEYYCTQSAANCTWNSTSYSCIQAGGLQIISVDSCQILDASDKKYSLTNNITNQNGTCFTINASNVELDCQGHTLQEIVGGNGVAGVYVYSGSYGKKLSGVTVRNCVIKNFDNGIYLLETENSSIHTIYVTSNGYGIHLYYSHGSTITNVTAYDNTLSGFDVESSRRNIFTNVIAMENNGGFNLHKAGTWEAPSDNNTFTHLTAINNTFQGIYIKYGDYNSFYNVTVSGHVTDGIHIEDANNTNVTLGTVRNNPTGVFLGGSKNHITKLNVTGSSNYGIRSTDWRNRNNLVFNNYFANNTVNAYSVEGAVNFWNTTKTAGTNIVGGGFLGGNFWDDYAGADTDGDGIGDTQTPYKSNNNISEGGDYLPLV